MNQATKAGHSPLDVASGAKLGASNEAHGAGREIRGVVHGIVELDHLQRGDERAGVGIVRVHPETEAHVPATRREHALVGRRGACQRVVGGVDGGPEGAIHGQVEDGRRRRGGGGGEERAVEEGGADEVAAVPIDGELVTELGPVTEREAAERGERRVDEAWERDHAGGTGRDVVAVGIPAEAAAVGDGGRRATV